MPGRVYNLLLERAQQQYGLLTLDDARALGVDPAQLRLMAGRGTLERRGRGIFRVPTVPPTALDPLMEATLWPAGGGVLSHETALDLYELCDVNPPTIHLIVAPGFRTRKDQPAGYTLHREDLPTTQTQWHEGIPIVSAQRAITGAIEDHLGWHLVDQAIKTARGRGLVTKQQASALSALRPTTAAADA